MVPDDIVQAAEDSWVWQSPWTRIDWTESGGAEELGGPALVSFNVAGLVSVAGQEYFCG